MNTWKDSNGVAIQAGVNIVSNNTGKILHVDHIDEFCFYAHEQDQPPCAIMLVTGNEWNVIQAANDNKDAKNIMRKIARCLTIIIGLAARRL